MQIYLYINIYKLYKFHKYIQILYVFNIYFTFFESKYIKQLVSNGSSKAYKYYGVSSFIDDICAIKDGNEFLTSFKNFYSKVLELKVEYQGNRTS